MRRSEIGWTTRFDPKTVGQFFDKNAPHLAEY